MPAVTVNGPEAARTLRELVAEESADSERIRTLDPPHRRRPLGQRAHAVVQPRRGRRERADLRRDDRHLDRAGLAGRLARAGSASPTCRRRRPVPPTCPTRGSTRCSPATTTGSPSAASSSPTGWARRSTAATGSPGPGTSVRAPGTPQYVAAGFIPTVGRRDGGRRRRHPPAAGGGHPPRRDRVHRRLACAGTARAPGRTTTT